MSDEKSRGDKASDVAKSIWLAGLGAYGKAFSDARDKIDGANLEPPRLFRELVEKGSQLEDDVRDSLSNIRKSGASSVEERINRVREGFHLSRGDEIAVLAEKMDMLIERVDALAAAIDQNSAPTKRASAKRASTKTSPKQKAAAKKTPGKQKAPSAKGKTAKKSPTRAKAKTTQRQPTSKATATRKR